MDTKEMALFSEKKAVHNALLETGFVYIGQNNLYVLNSPVGDIPLAGSICINFNSVIQRLGAVYFNTRYSAPALRKLHYQLSQELMGHYKTWEDLQIIRVAVEQVKHKV